VSLSQILDPLRDRPRRDKTVFFGDVAWAVDYYSGLFTSSDAGLSWARVALPGSGRIRTMQFENEGRIGFVVSDDGLLMRTTDTGRTWTTTDLVEQVRDVVDLDYGGYFDQLRFDAGLENGQWVDYCQIFKTSDGGKTWVHLADGLQDRGSEERCVANAVYDPENGSWFAEVEIYGRFLTSGNYLFRSDDSGKSWQEICSLDEVGLLLDSIPSCFEIETSDDGFNSAVKLFSEDIWSEETDAQEAFQDQINSGVFVAHSLVIPDDKKRWLDQVGLIKDNTTGRIWLSYDEQLAYTDDGGERWHVVSNGMPENENLDFSLGSDRGFSIYQNQFLAMSEDIGKTWTFLNTEPRPIYDFKVLPHHNRVIVATETGLGVVNAETLEWREVPEVSESAELVIAGPVVWAFTGNGNVHRSSDAGDTWMTIPVNFEREDFYVEAASCIAERCLLQSYDSVARLTVAPFDIEFIDLTEHLPDLDELYIVNIILDAELDRAWAVMEDGSLHASVNGGRTWRKLARVREELSEFSSSPGHTNFIAWGYTNRYLWSGDGNTFETRKFPTSKEASNSLCWVNQSIALLSAYDERQEKDLYFASIDGGATWGTTEPVTFDDRCRVPGGLVVLDTMIAKVK
jgi:photosystem II stability/assembly factor-like uncharacterized protein